MAFLPLLGGLLLSIVSGVVFRVHTALGIGYVTFTGVGQLQDRFQQEIVSNLNGLPVQIYQILAYMQFGTCINILLSAVAIRFTFMGWKQATGAITAWMILKNNT